MVDAAAEVVFNENIDIVPNEGDDAYTVPVAIGGHRSPLAVLQIVQPHAESTAQRQLYMGFYESYANQVAFILLYFFNLSTLQTQAASAGQQAQPASSSSKKK